MMVMQGLRQLFERDYRKLHARSVDRKQRRGGLARGAESTDPASLQVSDFQRGILENKDIMNANRYRAKLFNSMFNKK